MTDRLSYLNQFLATRRSAALKFMTDQGPTPIELNKILTVGTRVPDHGKYFPWHIVVIQGDDRIAAGELLKNAWLAENPDAPSAKLDLEAERFLRAPVVLCVVSKIRHGKKPAWEQILSAGALCYNLSLAANSLGYGTNWLTEWYSYSPHFKQSLGIAPEDHIAGFIYIGKTSAEQDDRERPDLSRIVTYWSKNTPLNTGTGYGLPDHGKPEAGFIYNTHGKI